MPPPNDQNDNHRRGQQDGGKGADREGSGEVGREGGEGVEVMDLDGRSEVFVNREMVSRVSGVALYGDRQMARYDGRVGCRGSSNLVWRWGSPTRSRVKAASGLAAFVGCVRELREEVGLDARGSRAVMDSGLVAQGRGAGGRRRTASAWLGWGREGSKIQMEKLMMQCQELGAATFSSAAFKGARCSVDETCMGLDCSLLELKRCKRDLMDYGRRPVLPNTFCCELMVGGVIKTLTIPFVVGGMRPKTRG